MASLPGSPRQKREETGTAAALKMRGYASYEPVIARHKSKTKFVCPGVRVQSLDGREPTALFPLSREELGEVWTTPEDLNQWDCEQIKGGWADAWWEFRKVTDYPAEYLTVLLTTLRTQQFLDGTPLSWRKWTAACRRQEDLMFVPITCTECDTPRALAMRTMLSSPQHLPAFTCRALGCQCTEPAPRILYQVPAAAWQHSRAESIRQLSRVVSVAPTYGLPEELLAPPSTKNISRVVSVNPQTTPQISQMVHRSVSPPINPKSPKTPSLISEGSRVDGPRFTWSQLENQRTEWEENSRRDDDAALNPYGCVLPKAEPLHYREPPNEISQSRPDLRGHLAALSI